MKPKLQYASRGDAVAEAQAKLNGHLADLSPPLAVDGIYGHLTVKRVEAFQLRRGLVADGVVGAKTWAALDSTSPAAPGKASPGPKSPHNFGKRVGNGARLRCSYGNRLGTLVFAQKDRQAATVKDRIPFINILPFGRCYSQYNPGVSASYEAYSTGVPTPCVCQPIVQSWTPGRPIETAGSPPAATLDMNSLTTCMWGGVITIVQSGS